MIKKINDFNFKKEFLEIIENISSNEEYNEKEVFRLNILAFSEEFFNNTLQAIKNNFEFKHEKTFKQLYNQWLNEFVIKPANFCKENKDHLFCMMFYNYCQIAEIPYFVFSEVLRAYICYIKKI